MRTKDLYVILLIIVSIVLFFSITGTVTSGYHFVDDHEILRINNDLSKESFFTVTAKWIKSDLTIRFRPMFYLHRILVSKVFGNNFTAWSIYTIYLLFISLLCFYYGMRKLSYSTVESLCFIIIVFIGRQMAVWWRLGPAETIGMFFLGLAFYSMTNCEKRYSLNTSLFCLFLICASLCKESFNIIIPAFLIFKIWHEKDLYKLQAKEVFLKNRLLTVPFVVMLINLLIIVFVVGANKIGYAGISGGIVPLLKGILSIIKNQLTKYIIIGVIFFGGICFHLKNKKKLLLFLKNLIFPFAICLLILVPNLIIYAKSGMDERYRLPSFIGIAFFIVSIVKEARFSSRNLSFIFLVIIVPFTLKPLYWSYASASWFSYEGNQNKVFLSAILDNYKEPANVVLVTDPIASFERSISLNTYLFLTKDIKLYVYPIPVPHSWGGWTDFRERLRTEWDTRFKQRMFSDMHGKPHMIIFLNKDLTVRFFSESGIEREKYLNILKEGIGYNIRGTGYAIFIENK